MTTTTYGLDSFFQNNPAATPKQVFNAAGVLGWSPHNKCVYSEDFAGAGSAYWQVSGGTLTPNAIAAPDAAVTATKLVETAVSSPHVLMHSGGLISSVLGETYTFSCYAKAAERTWLALMPTTSGPPPIADFFDIANGVMGASANNGQITAVGNGWYRCSITYVATGTAAACVIALRLANNDTNQAYVGVAGSGAYVWGTQVNTGPLQPYMKTNGSIRIGLAVDYHPVTHAPLGLWAEKGATNLLLNSTTLSTQSVTVSAVPYTLSFFGTGTITLSGVSTAGPLVGTGANNRVSLTFTPTAGSLTCTVSGSVTRAQLETGNWAGSPINTFGATVTRNSDYYTFLVSALPPWTTEFSIYARVASPYSTTGHWPICLTNGPGNDYIGFQISGGTINLAGADLGGTPCNVTGPSLAANVFASAAARLKLNDSAMSVNGAAPGVDAACTVATPLVKGVFASDTSDAAAPSSYYIQKLMIVPRGWSNPELQTQAAVT